MFKVLLVDDDLQSLDSTRKTLEISGYAVTTASDGHEGLQKFRAGHFDLVVSDVRMPRMGGIDFLRAITVCGDAVPVILMTAFGRIEDAVWAMKLGAVDFLTKPFKRQALIAAAEAALKCARVESPADAASPSKTILGHSELSRQLRGRISQIASTAASVLITGESGTGKELVAQSIHAQSARARAPFIALNCAAIPEALMESELFGCEKGAYTGATASRMGLFEAAHGGTLLLDEIGDLPHGLQAKLLRALQEGEIRRVGATASRKVDVRVIAATHRDLRAGVAAGTFRQDLMFRLEVIGLVVAPLRERMDDIEELALHFLAAASARHGKALAGISPEAWTVLKAHAWPGNIRELSNVVERAVVFASGSLIQPEDLPPHLADFAGKLPAATFSKESGSISVRLGTPLKDVEDLLIRKTLEATSGDKNMTARLLGINSRTIYRKLDKRSETD